MKALYKEFFKQIDTAKPMHVTVLHHHAEDDARAIKNQLRSEFSPLKIFTTIVTPIPRALTQVRAQSRFAATLNTLLKG